MSADSEEELCDFSPVSQYSPVGKPKKLSKSTKPQKKPQLTTAKPQRTTAMPQRTTAKPQRTTAKPQLTTAKTQRTTAKPQLTTAKTQRTTAKPQRTTAKPQRTTAKPQLTTAMPQRTTAKPRRTTAKPQRTTAKPQPIREKPSTTKSPHDHSIKKEPCSNTFPISRCFSVWQCSSGPIQVFNATPFDGSGKNYEYPIHLGAPIMVKLDINNPKSTYTQPNLRSTVNLWQWGGWAGCAWSSVPTLGLLSNLDACDNGVPCPVKPGRQELDVILDFTKYQQIINMLKDNAPYQLEYLLHDKVTGEDTCVMAQARAYLH